MNCKTVSEFIISWMENQLKESGQKGFVVGVSGGIDSALVSTLCAKTGFPLIALSLPILQANDQHNRSQEQLEWLRKNYSNVSTFTVDLTKTFVEMKNALPGEAQGELALVNTRSRLRMATLYSFANSANHLVAGTGNKIEDFGIGFFTKYGDGGVDISPIGDLVKSEVYQLAAYFGVPESIQKAAPTDGLWEKDRPDEEQIGASYNELEWAMDYCARNNFVDTKLIPTDKLSTREIEVLKIYLSRHRSSRHKMTMPPVCILAGIK